MNTCQVNFSNCEVAQPCVDVALCSAKLEVKLNQSLHDVEFLIGYKKTKGKDLSRFIEYFTNAESEYALGNEWFMTWSDIWIRNSGNPNGFKKMIREATKVNKARAKAQVKKEKAVAEENAKVAKAKAKAVAKAKACTLETCSCGCVMTRNKMAKHLKTKVHSELLTKKEAKNKQPLPTPSTTIDELDQLSQNMENDFKLFVLTRRVADQRDRAFVAQERASSMRVRDYISHVEAKMSSDVVVVEEMGLQENLELLNDIEARVNEEAWTVTTQMDTVMLQLAERRQRVPNSFEQQRDHT